MKKSILLPLVTGLFLAAVTALQAAEAASAKVFSVSGPSVLYRADGSEKPAEVGDVLRQGDGLVAGPVATVVLAFSNGSMLTLDPRASITLAEMSQQPFSGGAAYEQLSADPSVSTNLIELSYGNVGFEVKKLRPGSSFDIETTLGTASVRGTKGGVTFYPRTETGRAVATVNVSSGTVFFDTFLDGEVSIDATGSRTGNFSPNGSPASVEVTVGNPLIIYEMLGKRGGLPDRVFTPLDEIVVPSPENSSGSGGGGGSGNGGNGGNGGGGGVTLL